MADPRPPQPADESVAVSLAKLVKAFSEEVDEDYPCTWESSPTVSCEEWPGKPKKLAIVLSHHYTPASLTGIHALKGTDRSIAELIRAAAFSSPIRADATVESLARLAAKKLLGAGGQQYAVDPACKHAHELVSAVFKERNQEPSFDAAVSLATFWDHGEDTGFMIDYLAEEDETMFITTGPLISLTRENGAVPINFGPMNEYDLRTNYHPSYFGGEESRGPPFQYRGPIDFVYGRPNFDFDESPRIYGEQFVAYTDNRGANRTLPIYSHELLFASEEVSSQFRTDELGYGKHVIVEQGYPEPSPKDIEFRKYFATSLYKLPESSLKL